MAEQDRATAASDQTADRTEPAHSQQKGGLSELAKQEERLAWLLLLPTLLILIVIAIYPLGSVFYNSLTNRQFASASQTEFVGLTNYRELLSVTVRQLPPVINEETGQPEIDEETGEVVYERPIRVLPRDPTAYREVWQFGLLGNRYVIGATDRAFIRATFDTLLFTILSVGFETILGLGVALVLNVSFPGRGMMRAVMLIPWAVPTVVSARMWEFMFHSTRRGFFNVFFQKIGLIENQIAYLQTTEYQLPAMIAIDVWKTTPFMALLFLAGLQLISEDLYEAAAVDGAGKLRQFWAVTLPLLKPTLAVALIFRTLDALRVFDVFQVVLAQSRYSMASYTYYQLIDSRAMGYSSASSVVIFILIFIFAVIYLRTFKVETA